jgi:hypothetical protein
MNRYQIFDNIYAYVIVLSSFELGIGLYEAYILSENYPSKYIFTELQQIVYAFTFYKCILNNICTFINLLGLCCILHCSFADIFIFILLRVFQVILSLYGLNLCFSYDIDKFEPFSAVIGFEALLFSITIVVGLCKYVKMKFLD